MKTNALREMTDEELQEQYRESARELFNLRMQQATGQIENPLRIRHVRRDIARMKTVMQERTRAARTA